MKKKEVIRIKRPITLRDNSGSEFWIESLVSCDLEDEMDEFAAK